MSDYTKVCTVCQEELPATTKFFHKKRDNADNLNSKCKKCRSKIRKERYKSTTKKIELELNKIWREKNRERLNSKERQRRKIDINYRLLKNLRCRLWLLVKQNRCSDTMSLVGCSIDYLKFYLEQQFTNGMTWANYGEWHIDHIKPCAAFDLTKEKEQRKCFHYTNLQPLWAADNLQKSDKVLDREQ